MAIFSASYQIGSMTDIDKDTAQTFMTQFKDTIKGIDAIGIFAHNTEVCIGMFIPAVGMVWGMLTGAMTGVAYKAAITLAPGIAQKIPALALLFLSPFGIMELTSYGIAMSRSWILIRAIMKKQLRKEIKPTLIEVGIIVGILLSAGFIEYYMITNAAFKMGLGNQ